VENYLNKTKGTKYELFGKGEMKDEVDHDKWSKNRNT
jgi:hypothetical protein